MDELGAVDAAAVVDGEREALARVSSLDAIAETAQRTGAIFLCFLESEILPGGSGDGPASGAPAATEISAWQVLPEPWWTASQVEWIARQLAEHFPDLAEERLPYMVTGRVIRRDDDGALLRAGTTAVAEITMAA
jgi:hypothetical protein